MCVGQPLSILAQCLRLAMEKPREAEISPSYVALSQPEEYIPGEGEGPEKDEITPTSVIFQFTLKQHSTFIVRLLYDLYHCLYHVLYPM